MSPVDARDDMCRALAGMDDPSAARNDGDKIGGGEGESADASCAVEI